LRQVLSGDDLARIRQLTQSLEQVVMSLSQTPGPEAAYPKTAESGSSGSDQVGNPPGNNNNTVEGDFREV
jgi:hypothetical protein